MNRRGPKSYEGATRGARGNLDRHANYIVVGFIEGSGQDQPAV